MMMRNNKTRVNKLHLVRCVLMFLVSWCFLLLLIYYFFHKDLMNSNTLRGMPSLTSIRVFSDSFLSNKIKDTTYTIPSINDNIEKDIMHIYLDFPLDDRLFTIDNYKSLESLLNIYPSAKFRCQIYTSRNAYFYKIGNSLSINQFIKYKKLQYDISVVPYNMKLKSRTTLYGIIKLFFNLRIFI